MQACAASVCASVQKRSHTETLAHTAVAHTNARTYSCSTHKRTPHTSHTAHTAHTWPGRCDELVESILVLHRPLLDRSDCSVQARDRRRQGLSGKRRDLIQNRVCWPFDASQKETGRNGQERAGTDKVDKVDGHGVFRPCCEIRKGHGGREGAMDIKSYEGILRPGR